MGSKESALVLMLVGSSGLKPVPVRREIYRENPKTNSVKSVDYCPLNVRLRRALHKTYRS